jgi:hypothetical protein
MLCPINKTVLVSLKKAQIDKFENVAALFD